MRSPSLKRGSKGQNREAIPVCNTIPSSGLRRDGKGVAHHRRIDILKRAGINELDLATAALLCRRAEKADAGSGTRMLDRRDDAEESCDGRGRDQVMTAAVTDLRQRIILAAERHDAAATPIFGREGRLEAVGVRRDGDAAKLEEGHDVVVGFELGIAEFRIIVDLSPTPLFSVACPDRRRETYLEVDFAKLAVKGIDRVAYGIFDRGGGHAVRYRDLLLAGERVSNDGAVWSTCKIAMVVDLENGGINAACFLLAPACSRLYIVAAG